jgi:hypothetical protein
MNQRVNQMPFISKGQTTQWPKENEPKEESEAFHQQRADNTMPKENEPKSESDAFHQRRTDNTMTK